MTLDDRPLDGVVKHFGRITGGHGRDTAGILLTSGPLFAQGVSVEASVRDLAPTILHALGLPVADDFPGKVVTGLFTEEAGRRPVRRIGSWGTLEAGEARVSAEDRRLLEELGALGYLE